MEVNGAEVPIVLQNIFLCVAQQKKETRAGLQQLEGEVLSVTKFISVKSKILDKYNINDLACDLVFLGDQLPSFSFPGNLKQVYSYEAWRGLVNKDNCYPILDLDDFNEVRAWELKQLNFLNLNAKAQTLESLENRSTQHFHQNQLNVWRSLYVVLMRSFQK